MELISADIIIKEAMKEIDKFAKESSFLIRGTIERKAKEFLPLIKDFAKDIILTNVYHTVVEILNEKLINKES
jgi:hypothetical protein